MTELAPAPSVARGFGRSRDCAHPPLDRRRPGGRHLGPHEPGLQPRGGTADRGGAARERGGGRSRRPVREDGVRLVAHRVAREARRADVRDPGARARAQGGDRADPHGRARQGAVGRDGRGDARPRGDRVRVRDPDPAQGRILRAGVDGRRRLLDPPADRRRRGNHAVQLPGHGPHVDVGARARMRQHVRAEAVGEGSFGLALHRGAAQGGGRPGRRLQRDPGRQGRRRRAARSTPTSALSASWARPRSRATSTRPARGPGSACRRSVGRRTT